MGKNILLVDDEAVIRYLFSEILGDYKGYNTIQAQDGCDAVEKLRESELNGQQIDLVVTDCEMPGMNGYKLSRYVKENYGIPVIMASGTAEHDIADTNGIDLLLNKPVSPSELVEAVKKFLPQ